MEHTHDFDDRVEVSVDEEVSWPVHSASGSWHMVSAQPKMPGDEVNPEFGTPRGTDALGLSSHVAECCREQRLVPLPGGLAELFLRPSQDAGDVGLCCCGQAIPPHLRHPAGTRALAKLGKVVVEFGVIDLDVPAGGKVGRAFIDRGA